MGAGVKQNKRQSKTIVNDNSNRNKLRHLAIEREDRGTDPRRDYNKAENEGITYYLNAIRCDKDGPAFF